MGTLSELLCWCAVLFRLLDSLLMLLVRCGCQALEPTAKNIKSKAKQVCKATIKHLETSFRMKFYFVIIILDGFVKSKYEAQQANCEIE
jgi:hypothetical protein